MGATNDLDGDREQHVVLLAKSVDIDNINRGLPASVRPIQDSISSYSLSSYILFQRFTQAR